MSGVKLGGRESADLTIPECGLGFGHYVYDQYSPQYSTVMCTVFGFTFLFCKM